MPRLEKLHSCVKSFSWNVSDRCLLTLCSLLFPFTRLPWCLQGRNNILTTLLNYKRFPQKNQGLSCSTESLIWQRFAQRLTLKEAQAAQFPWSTLWCRAIHKSEERALKRRACCLLSFMLRVRASQVVLVVKNLPASAGDIGDGVQPLSWEDPPVGGNGNPLQHSHLENPMDRGAWQSPVLKVAQSQTWLTWLSTHTY